MTKREQAIEDLKFCHRFVYIENQEASLSIIRDLEKMSDEDFDKMESEE